MNAALRLLSVSISIFAIASSAAAEEENVAQEEAIAAIQKMKGRVVVDAKRPGKPVTQVHLFGGKTKGIGLAPLAKLPDVDWIGLHLSDITEEDLEYLKPLKLRRVGLADIKLTDSGVARIAGITTIETLYLMENPITDAALVHLRGMTNIKLLAIGTSKITDAGIAHLAPLVNLEELWLDRTAVTDAGLKQLKPFTKLQRLGLDGLRGVSDLSPLKTLPLKELSLAYTSVADLSPVKEMKLTKLNCFATKVTDLSPLAECKTLISLNVRGTKVPQSEVETLQKALPNCKVEWDAPKAATQPAADKPKP